jgi:hypothetical protein
MGQRVGLRQTAYAARLTPRGLYHVLDKGFRLGQPHLHGCWHRIDRTDVLRLAIAGRLLRYGFDALETDQIMTASIDCRILGHRPNQAAANLAGLALYIGRNGNRAVDLVELRSYQAADDPRGTVLRLDVGHIAADALQRLAEAGAMSDSKDEQP